MSLSIGFDPEFFVAQTGHRTPIPVCGLIGGTKAEPIQMGPDGFNYHEDNVVAEIGVPPSNDPYIAANILADGISMLDTRLKKAGLRRLTKAEHTFPMELLQTIPQAMEFGCDPDYNAYEGGIRPRQNPPDFGSTRFAGGHIHLGGDFNCPAFVVALFCDLALATRGYVGGTNLQRRSWYGAAGSYRIKDYGIEYRTLDCLWTANEDTRFDTIQRAWAVADWCERASALEIKKAMDSVNWVAIRDYINTSDGTTPRRDVDVELKKARRMGVPV